MDKEPMTLQGADALQKELEQLKNVDRKKVIAAIAEARAHGDLKENAEYHAAREKQSFLEGRIKDVEGKLSNSQVIDVATLPKVGKVVFATTVSLVNIETDEKVKYQIVGDDEADLKLGKISFRSPIARGLIGKSEGDEVGIVTPGGEVEYEILSVEYL